MTKKNYELIASVLNEYLDDGDNDQLNGIAGAEKVARMLATAMQADNDRFDKKRFLSACGLEA